MNLEQLNENRVESALKFLSSTDEEHAILGGEVKKLEEGLKMAKAHSFLMSDGTVANKEAEALTSPKYRSALDEWIEAYKAFKILDNKRQHEIRIIEVFQTLSANRRKGTM